MLQAPRCIWPIVATVCVFATSALARGPYVLVVLRDAASEAWLSAVLDTPDLKSWVHDNADVVVIDRRTHPDLADLMSPTGSAGLRLHRSTRCVLELRRPDDAPSFVAAARTLSDHVTPPALDSNDLSLRRLSQHARTLHAHGKQEQAAAILTWLWENSRDWDVGESYERDWKLALDIRHVGVEYPKIYEALKHHADRLRSTTGLKNPSDVAEWIQTSELLNDRNAILRWFDEHSNKLADLTSKGARLRLFDLFATRDDWARISVLIDKCPDLAPPIAQDAAVERPSEYTAKRQFERTRALYLAYLATGRNEAAEATLTELRTANPSLCFRVIEAAASASMCNRHQLRILTELRMTGERAEEVRRKIVSGLK